MLLLAEFIVWIVGVAILVLCYLPVGAPQPERPRSPSSSQSRSAQAPVARSRRSAFRAYRLTPSTFLVVEHNDIYSEHPFIYVKVVPHAGTILLLDTGCGGATPDKQVEITSLREFIETVAVEANGGRPINEGGKLRYVVVLSHCHYDHILGVEHFASDSPILESGYSHSFVARTSLPTHSLCASLGIRTPSFAPTLVPHNHPLVSHSAVPLGVTLLHTPGHTPDQLALWDAAEQMLYVGDTLYEWAPIVFPNEGDICAWLASVDALIALVRASRQPEAVMINSGHQTTMRPALEVLAATRQFMMDVLVGREQVKSRTKHRGLDYVHYAQEGRRYSLRCPERLIEEARRIL